MSKRYAVRGFAIAALCACLAMSMLHAGSATAAEAPAKAKPVTAAAPKKVAAKSSKEHKAKPPRKTLAELRAEEGVFAERTNWISLRAGYAKGDAEYAGDGIGGYGVGYQRMLSHGWSLGASAHHELLGHLGASYEIVAPMTIDLERHFKWHTTMRPYVGFGAGYYFHKFYRTMGTSTGRSGTGFYFDLGADTPIEGGHLLGFETRMNVVDAGREVNPIFGPQKPSEVMWSAMFTWSFAYNN